MIEHGKRMRLPVVRPDNDGFQRERNGAVRFPDDSRNLQDIEPHALGARLPEQRDREKCQ